MMRLEVGTKLATKVSGFEHEITAIGYFDYNGHLHVRYNVNGMWKTRQEILQNYAVMLSKNENETLRFL